MDKAECSYCYLGRNTKSERSNYTARVQLLWFSLYRSELSLHPLTHPPLLFCLHTGPSRAEVTGLLSNNITLQFPFNVSISNNSHFAVYIDSKKIAEYRQGDRTGVFDVYSKNTTVFYHITNLNLNDSGYYWASLFKEGYAEESDKVQLIVREENRSSTGEDRL